MLCRALLVAAVVSYVLCVLLLSGVQKEDLDAATLRKLQRYNVNISDIDGKIRDQCLALQNAATSSSTTEQVELNIKPNKSTSPLSTEVNSGNGPSAAELKKIMNYFKEKETQREINIIEQTTKSSFMANSNMVDLSKLPSSVRSRLLKDMIDSRTATQINRVANKYNERLTLAHDDNDLQNIEKVQQERSTVRLVPDNTKTEKANDVEYISKIVAQVLAQRQFNQQTTTTPPPTTHIDRIKLAQAIHSILAKDLIKNIPQNYYFNNLNLTDMLNSSPGEPKSNGEEKDVIDALLSQLKNRGSLSNSYLLGGLKKDRNFGNDQVSDRFETKLKEKSGGNNILLNRRDDINKAVIVSSNRNLPVVDGQFLSKWQSVNGDGNTKSLETSLSGNNVRCLIFSHPNGPCKIQNNNEFYPNDAYRSLWLYIIDGLSKGDLKVQDVQKITSIYWPPDSKVKPAVKNDLNIDNRFKTEWLFNSRSGEQFQFKDKYRQNPANDPLANNNPSMERKFSKNTWTDYYEDPRFKQQYNSLNRNKLSRIVNENSQYNHRINSNEEEISLMNQPKNREKLSETVQRLILRTDKEPDLDKPYKSNKVYLFGKEDTGKPKSIPPGMIKEIADSVKELVLRDLKKELSTTSATTTVSPTTPSTTTPTTTTTSTATPATTAQTTTTTTTTTKKPTTTAQTTITTTTEKLSTAAKENHVKIQEASKALEKFMEVFEKFKSIKDSIVVPENITFKEVALKDNTIKNNLNFKVVNNDPRPFNPMYPKPYDVRNQMNRPKPLNLDPYSDQTTLDPIKTRRKNTKKPPGFALTLQTNSDEIPPLNVAVSRPLSMHNTIVVTPLPSRPKNRNLQQSRYSAETRYSKPEQYQVDRAENQPRFGPSKGSYRDSSNFKYASRSKTRNSKRERSYKDPGYKPHGVEKFHEKLERADNWQSYAPGEKCSLSRENCNEPVASRKQRPLINTGTSYDDTHFRNFLKTQQKVTDMLEKILATNTKHIPRSAEII